MAREPRSERSSLEKCGLVTSEPQNPAQSLDSSLQGVLTPGSPRFPLRRGNQAVFSLRRGNRGVSRVRTGSEPVRSRKRASLRVAAPHALWEVISALQNRQTGLRSPVLRDAPSEGEISRFSPSEGEISLSGGSEPVLSRKRASLRVAAPQALWEVIFALQTVKPGSGALF